MRTRHAHRSILAVALLMLIAAATALAACGGDGQIGPIASIVEAHSDKERIADPEVSVADVDEQVRGNSTFAFDLYRLLSEEDGNLFLSPYSISAALAMTYAGARSGTEQEMADALNFVLPQSSLHPAFNALDLSLTEQPEPLGIEGATGDPLQLSIANALWGERTHEFLPEFLDTLAENYGAGMNLVDFINAFEAARLAINGWVSDRTQGRIPELLEAGTLDSMTRLVLTNAIYFKASWLNPFPPEDTQDGAFHLLDGSEVQTPMMHLNARIGYGELDGVQAVPLRYEGSNYTMYVLLPPEGEFEAFEAGLDAAAAGAIIDSVGDAQVDLTMPKFEFDSSFSLPETLTALGMESAFGDADFSGMDGTRTLYISDVIHKAFVGVDEEGTEAAAATGVVVEVSSAPQLVELVLDRPFLFLIRHEDTGTVLFLGRVLDPTV